MGDRTALLRAGGDPVAELPDISAEVLAARAADPASVLWLDLADPGADELALLRDGPDLHPLAVEDIQKGKQRPKIDAYPSHYVIVAYEASALVSNGTGQGKGGGGRDLAELHLVVSRGALVSIHREPSASLSQVERMFRRDVPGTTEDTGALLYTILDTVTDGYMPLLDRVSDEIGEIEEAIAASQTGRDALRDVLRVRRQLLELRRVIAPLRDVANALLRRELEVVKGSSLPYYQDLYDHLVRILDAIDLYREILAAALDANLAMASNSLNLVVRRLTALTVILMLPTMIAGIYGMNFSLMPELDWALGYPYALALMAVAVLAAVAFFRARGWL